MKFLIDECLSPDLVSTAAQAGYAAVHVAHIGQASRKDWTLLDHVIAEDFILVTNNAVDFRRLYATQPLHAGLVIIIPNVPKADQQRLFRGALDALGTLGEPVNQVLEIDVVGGEVTFDFYDLPADFH